MESFIGTILIWPMNWAPQNWAICDGSLLPIQQNAALFSLLGTTFGGNGTTTFALPDLRGRMPIGMGQGPGLPGYTVGQQGGVASTALTLDNLPAHTHAASFTPSGGGSASVSISTDVPSAATPVLANGDTAYLANANAGALLKGLYTKTAPAQGATATIPVNGGGGSGTVTVSPAGNGQAFDNHPPFLGINFIICVNGIYPSRP